jgi:hypothetical protein
MTLKFLGAGAAHDQELPLVHLRRTLDMMLYPWGKNMRHFDVTGSLVTTPIKLFPALVNRPARPRRWRASSTLRILAYAGMLAAVAIAVIAGAPQARATLISGTYQITASGFGAGAPVPTVMASFTVTFNNSANIPDTSSGLTVNSLNLAVDGSAEYDYFTAPSDTISFGGSESGVAAVRVSFNDFIIIIRDASTASPSILSNNVTYTAATDEGIHFVSSAASVSFTPSTTSTPEPSALALLGTSLAGLFLLMPPVNRRARQFGKHHPERA